MMFELQRYSKIQPKDWFSNDMKNRRLENADYLKIQNYYQTLYELLKHYDNKETVKKFHLILNKIVLQFK
jgi:hypothetical protein